MLISDEATNGIVLATEKKSSSPLIDPPSLSKVSLITPNIGMVYSGMGPDYRVLVDKARKVSHTAYKRIYNEYPPTRILVQDVARVMQEATQSGGVRPYGVSLLIAGWDDGVEPETQELADEGLETDAEKKKASGKTGGILKGGPSLYQVDPSGSCKQCPQSSTSWFLPDYEPCGLSTTGTFSRLITYRVKEMLKGRICRLPVESHRHWQKRHQREDLSREEI